MSSADLVLASGSPRRRQLLTDAGFRYRVLPARDGAEDPGLCSNCSPAELVADLATRKLADVVDQLGDAAAGVVVLAADTVAECRGRVLGKPANEDHAREILGELSGRAHRVLTGVALTTLGAGDAPHVEVTVTDLEMDALDPDWLERYLESGRWAGKAGAFGYQDGLGFVRVVRGSETNVVGLPMERVAQLLAERGVVPANGPAA